MTRRRALIAFTTALIGCDDSGTGVFLSGAPIDASTSTAGGIEWRGTVSPSNTASPLRGSAFVRMNATEQTFVATLALRDDAPGARRPWHVHFGSCMERGSIVGDDRAYPRLDVTADGTATANVSAAIGLDPTVPYYVDVHPSDANSHVVIACGNLAPQ